ncbi:uncharacterized protein TRIADDRAFT_28310, partial [Trichoplax adhaerens]
RKLLLKDINEHITCGLCKGYLVDASTITECLHTYCKSCLVRYVQDSNRCPTCDIVIHETQPLYNIRMDRTMQDIVDKFVPWLKEAERERLNKFYIDHGLQNPFTTLTKQDKYRDDRQRENIEKRHDYDYHRSDEQIAICFRCADSFSRSLERNFILCSSQITIRHLKKFLIKKLCLPSLDNIIITCNGVSVGQSHSMQFVRLTHWLKVRFRCGD